MKSFDDLPKDYRRHIHIDETTKCWLWTGCLNFHGYGRKRAPKPNPTGNVLIVHRQVYKMLVGPIPDEKSLDHLCRVRRCCNPQHLEPVTPQENTRRGMKNQYNLVTHCPNGHPYAGENLVTYFKNGKEYRACLTCKRACLHRWRTRNNIGRIRVDNAEKRDRYYLLGNERRRPNYKFKAKNIRLDQAVIHRSAEVAEKVREIVNGKEI